MITKIDIEEILSTVNENVSVIQSLDFASDANSETIILGEAFEEDFKEIIKEVYDRLGIHLNCSYETFAVLHELGHVETLGHLQEDDLEEILEKYVDEKERYEGARTDADKFYLYTQLELEQLANDWAVDFMELNPSLVEKLDRVVNEYYANLNSEDLFFSLLTKKFMEVV